MNGVKMGRLVVRSLLLQLQHVMVCTPMHACFLQGRLVVLGGAFTCNGNVNPAAEANIFGDPDAANVVFGRQAVVLGGCSQAGFCRQRGSRATNAAF